MPKKRYIDISVSVSPWIVSWPGSPSVKFRNDMDMARGDATNDTSVHLSVHTGTHIDAPLHFLADGKSVDQLNIDDLIGSALVVDLPETEAIDAKILESLNILPKTRRLLFKTKNSMLWQRSPGTFNPNFVALTADGARWVVERKIKLVGIDYLSIQRFSDGPQTHRILLGAGVIVLEGLDLGQVRPGKYELICLPLKFTGLEGSPVRAILMEK